MAAEVLAVLVLDDLWPDATAVAGMFKAYAAGVTAPGVLRACTEFSLRSNDIKTARSCAMQALARGADSTWHLLRLTRIAFREADTVGGSKQFFAAIAAAHDTAARAEAEWHLQWFLEPKELPLPAQLPDTARARWTRDLLVRRDVRDGQPIGARLAEHFSRLEYVLAHFRLHVPVTIRKQLAWPRRRTGRRTGFRPTRSDRSASRVCCRRSRFATTISGRAKSTIAAWSGFDLVYRPSK